MSSTARFAFPLLAAGQAQKELSHNEALTLIDALVHACVEAAGENTPPAGPVPGQCWIVGAASEAEWAGNAQKLAIWTGGGWRFIEPREGLAVHVRSDDMTAWYVDGNWTLGAIKAAQLVVAGDQVVGARQPDIAEPSGGTVVDVEARTAITAILGSLRTHGLIGS